MFFQAFFELKFVQVAIAIFIRNFGGFLNGIAVIINIEWWKHLIQPSFNIPMLALIPVWTLFYSTMGYASFVVWKKDGYCMAFI